MSVLILEIDAEEIVRADSDGAQGYVCDGDGDGTARISNEAAENGYEQEPGPLTWLNSARVTADADEDAVHCVVSVGDPRGGFCMTIRRTADGHIVLHLPHPNEGFAHMPTRQLHEGTLVVVDHQGKEVSFADDIPTDEED